MYIKSIELNCCTALWSIIAAGHRHPSIQSWQWIHATSCAFRARPVACRHQASGRQHRLGSTSCLRSVRSQVAEDSIGGCTKVSPSPNLAKPHGARLSNSASWGSSDQSHRPTCGYRRQAAAAGVIHRGAGVAAQQFACMEWGQAWWAGRADGFCLHEITLCQPTAASSGVPQPHSSVPSSMQPIVPQQYHCSTLIAAACRTVVFVCQRLTQSLGLCSRRQAGSWRTQRAGRLGAC